MFSTAMKINEKNVVNFASSDSTVDREGYLLKKYDVKGSQRRWFVLKGNLLFYYDKKQDKDPAGLVVLESYSVQASATEKHGFEISFDGPGTRTYILVADNDDEMQSWMRSVSHASYEFLRGIVNELQKQVTSLTSHGKLPDKPAKQQTSDKIPILPKPRVKVENGVLVDVDGDAPPIPPKKKMTVIKSASPEPSSLPTEPVRYHPTAPFTNPVIVPSSYSGSSEPLSPNSTMDRTPVLAPVIVTDTPPSNGPPPIPAKPSKKPVIQAEQFNNSPPSTFSPAIGVVGLDTTNQNAYDLHTALMDAVKESGSSSDPSVSSVT